MEIAVKLLFIASEGDPFVKTGGLADVIGALPASLREEGADVRVILPNYESIPEHFKSQMVTKQVVYVPVGWRYQYCGLKALEWEGTTYYFIDNEYYFKRAHAYGHYDDAERFAFFSRAVLEVLPHLDFQPDILHCHDWQTGMIPVFLKAHYAHRLEYQELKTVFTIHNLKYQGIFHPRTMRELLDLDESYLTMDGVEYHGNVNFMKGALNFADKITTVSQTYANEIQTPYYGEGLDGLLRARSADFTGIVNGIDDKGYNPKTDEHLFARYAADPESAYAGKRENKIKLQEMLHLEVNADVPMIGIITRLVEQKGLDLVLHILEELLHEDVQVVLLGTGDYRYEEGFRYIAGKYPSKCNAYIGFSEAVARKVYAAADMFLMPSLFEPCGLSQLIALRYGSVPIVRETGGLKDTVQSYNEYTGEGNGFSFTHYNAHDMLFTIKRALEYYSDEATWKHIMHNGFKRDYSWKQSAGQYLHLYKQL